MDISIDHLGIAVKSLASAKAIYEKLGLAVSPEETVEQEQVRLVMVPVGESRLELLEATSEDSTIAKFIAKRGEGLHHVSLRVPDLPAAVEGLKGGGGRADTGTCLCIPRVRAEFCWSWWTGSPGHGFSRINRRVFHLIFHACSFS